MPSVSVTSWHSDVPIRTEICRGEAPHVPAGLTVRSDGGNVTAVYAMGHSPHDCSQDLSVLGNFTARVGEGRSRLIGFITTSSSDDCRGNPPYAPNPRITVQAGPFPPGTVDVVVFHAAEVVFGWPSPGWDEFRGSVEV
jgi:hypothetical protein